MIHMEIEKLFQKFQLRIQKWFNLEFILDSTHISNQKILVEYWFQERLHFFKRLSEASLWAYCVG